MMFSSKETLEIQNFQNNNFSSNAENMITEEAHSMTKILKLSCCVDNKKSEAAYD